MPPSAKQADLGVEIGQVFLGKYRVDAILGHGGMGVVAQCHHLQLDKRIAIKMLRPDVLGDQDAVQRFLREAQAAAKLQSEHVARVEDVGAFETGVPYMVMEFLDGYDLGQMIDNGKTLSVPLTIELSLHACEALAEAHSQGIVHRDVKPTNLFVVWRADKPHLKVLDFGISKSQGGADLKLTQTQSLLGTPAYMSPEQMRSAREVDARTDIWSLGTVMYEAIEGRRPFEAESFSEMVVKVSMEAPTPMRQAPLGLQQVILRCLCKQPEQRFQSMADLGRELVPYAGDQHAAQTLVERMQRMLRRSQAWDAGNNAAMPGMQPAPATGAVMMAMGHMPSAPAGPVSAAMPQPPQPAQAAPPAGWHGDSQPAAPMWAGGSQINAEPWPSVQGTNPMAHPVSAVHARAPIQTEVVQRPRGGVPLGMKLGVLAVAALLGATFAILSTSKQNPDDKKADDKAGATGVVAPVVTPRQPPPPAPVVAPPSPTPPPSPVTVPTAGSARAGSAGDIDIDADGKATQAPFQPPHKPIERGHGPVRHGPHSPLLPVPPPSPPPSPASPPPVPTTPAPTPPPVPAPATSPTASPAAGGDARVPGICPNGTPAENYAHGCPK